MKSIFTLLCLLTMANCTGSAQTNEPSPKHNEWLKRVRAEVMREQPVHAEVLVVGGETRCQVFFFGHTNLIAYVPLPEQTFEARLFSENGKEISKAWFNHKFGQPLKPDKNLLAGCFSSFDGFRSHDRQLEFKNGNYSDYWDVDVVKSFRVKQPGKYRLQVQGRLFTKDTNGVYQPFLLPPVEAKVDISKRQLD